MIKQKSSIQIDRPVSDVFTFVSNPENIPKWQSEVVTAKLKTPGAIKAGTQFDETVKIFGKQTPTVCEITEYQPTKRFAFKSITSSGPVFYDGSFTFEPDGRGTILTIDANISLRGIWKLVEPLFGMDVKKAVRKELESLKLQLENNNY